MDCVGSGRLGPVGRSHSIVDRRDPWEVGFWALLGALFLLLIGSTPAGLTYELVQLAEAG